MGTAMAAVRRVRERQSEVKTVRSLDGCFMENPLFCFLGEDDEDLGGEVEEPHTHLGEVESIIKIESQIIGPYAEVTEDKKKEAYGKQVLFLGESLGGVDAEIREIDPYRDHIGERDKYQKEE